MIEIETGIPIEYVCRWRRTENRFGVHYDTQCNNAFQFIEPNEGPEEHQFHYCPYCGRKLVLGE